MQTLENQARSTLRRFEWLLPRVESLVIWQVIYSPMLIATYYVTGEALRQHALARTADDFDSLADYSGWRLRIRQTKLRVIGIAVMLNMADQWTRNQMAACN